MVKSKLTGRVLASMLAVALVALVGVFAFSQAPVAQAASANGGAEKIWAAEDAPDVKWGKFAEAVKKGGTVTLDAGDELVAYGEIEIPNGVTVTVNGDGKIIRDANRDNSFPVFKVANGGNLTLGGRVVLSGETQGCGEVTIPGTSGSGGTVNLKVITPTSELPDFWGASASNEGETFSVGLSSTAYTLHPVYTWDQFSANGEPAAITNPSVGDHVVVLNSDKETVCIQQGGTEQPDTSYENACDKGFDFAGFQSEVFEVVSITGGTPSTPETKKQQCDGKVDCDTYTSETFASGTATDPKGFFVEVEAGGTATLSGATLTNFIADGSVHHAAPVVVKGGTFDIKSGSITGNSVGYDAKHEMNNATADAIGKETEDGSYSYNGAMADWAKSETAGGVIYTDGASGEITGGSIAGNRGDTGGVLVQSSGNADDQTTQGKTSKVKLTGGTIDSNFGVHHGGGVTVYNGAAVQMEDGATISSNFSWHKGGGVFVSEEVFGSMRSVADFGGPAKKDAGEATFIMLGGTISNNVAVHRGGGIEVASNHVVLKGGTISGNNSRTLGGGIYVEGDEGRMYQLYVENGCITGNAALSVADETAATRGPSNTASGCDFKNDMNAPTGSDATFKNGFWGEIGDGGGLWLCPLGGNSTFALGTDTNGNTFDVVVAGNEKAGSGKDVYITRPRSGVGNGINVVDLGTNNQFKDERTNATLKSYTTYAGELALANDVQTCSGGVLIEKNSAVNGGGIAANGTVLFGNPVDTYRASADLDLSKLWGSERNANNDEAITLKLFVEDGGQRAELGEIDLDGVADATNAATAWYESDAYKASIGLPLAVTMPDGSTKPLFTTDAGDPSDIRVLEDIVKNNLQVKLADWNLEIEETDASGKTMTYVLPSGDAVLTSTTSGPEDGQPVTYYDIDGKLLAGPVGTYSVNFAFAQEIANDNEPTIEKYVAKDVDAEVEIGEEFDYDILAYVPLDADSIEINDTLENSLELVSTEADIEGSVVVKKTNDHTVNGTVAGGEVSDAKVSAKATIDGQSIKVEIADATPARGQYIQLTFKAKLTADAEHETITDNGTVLGGADSHEGVPNDATYKIKVGNDWSSDYESNTVTVKPKPEEPAIEKYVNKDVHKDIEIDEEFTYDVLAYITKDADEATITDTLEGILEFATEASAVTVVDLGEEVDHTPNGSVAKDGSPVTGAVPAISGQTLTVTIADATALRGHWVKVTFDAKVKAGTKASDLAKAYKTISNNDPVITDEEHTGIPNTASYEIRVKNESGVAEKKYEKPSNTVTVKPDVEVPELEKYIAQDVHLADVEIGAAFTYDIVAYVTKDADEIEITDVLNTNLDFASAEGDVKVADLGTTNNHNTNGDFTAKNENATVASAGTEIDANVAISGKTLTVGITDIASKDLRGHYVRVTFDAKIAQDAGYEKVDDNGTVNSDKAHEGIPNKASYRTKVGNEWNSDYDLESNVVTVTLNKPDEPKPEEPKPDNPKPENPTPGDNPQPEETLSAEASTVTKTWADGGNTKDRDDVEFQLYRKVGDGAWELVQGQSVTLTSEDSDGLTTWTGHFDNLPAYENGQKISYRAAEANSADFEGLYTPDSDEEIIIVDVDSTSGMGATNHPFTPNTSVDISKQEVGGGPELPGATLIVRDAEGKEIERWVSGTEPHSLTLEPGVYTLTEVTAPNGYDVAETMTFRVNVDGTIELLQNGEWLSVEDHIVMFDAPTTPGKPDNPKTPTPGKPSNPGTPTTSKAPTPTSSARTADAVGGVTVALLFAALLGAGGVAYAGSRSRTSRKK